MWLRLVLVAVIVSACACVPLRGLDSFDILRNCTEKCTQQITWDEPEWACSLDNEDHVNSGCMFGSVMQCWITRRVRGTRYPGTCGCPNNCSQVTGQGMCVNGKCMCKTGFTGPDCSLVTVENTCNGVGAVKEVNGKLTCVCPQGGDWQGIYCSDYVGELPPVSQTIRPVAQYSSKDVYGDNHPIYNMSTVAQIRVYLKESDLEFLLDPANQQTREYQPARMWFYNGEVSDVVDDIGFRLKGGISRQYVKKTWKFSFNKFVKGRQWYGMKKLQLKGMSFDPTFSREFISSRALYSMNSPVQRMSFADLYVNDIHFGAYIMLENIDELFLNSRMGNDNGLLYKCVGDLEWLGPDPAAYKDAMYWDRIAYAAQTDAAEKDFSKIRNLIAVLQIEDEDKFLLAIQDVLDVDSFLRAVAMEVATGQSDGIYNANNYWLYYDLTVDKFTYFRHDLDLSFGLFNDFDRMDTQDVNTWGQEARGYRLINRIIQNPAFQPTYERYVKDLLNTYVNNPVMTPLFSVLQERTRSLSKRDLWHHYDYMYSQEEFEISFKETFERITPSRFLPQVTIMGLEPFLAVRYPAAMAQFALNNTSTQL